MVKLVARTFDQVRVEYSCHSGRIHMCWCCQTGDRVGFAGNGVGAAAGRRPIAADLSEGHILSHIRRVARQDLVLCYHLAFCDRLLRLLQASSWLRVATGSTGVAGSTGGIAEQSI